MVGLISALCGKILNVDKCSAYILVRRPKTMRHDSIIEFTLGYVIVVHTYLEFKGEQQQQN